MFQNIVIYRLHEKPLLPPNNALAYQYVLAAAGVYLRAENRFFDVLAPMPAAGSAV